MPVSSFQINQMMAGQQAMFGNAATYAQQISPMGQASGMAPTYAMPYGPMASPGTAEFNQGMAATPGLFNAAASYGAPVMMGAGALMGGRMGSMLDPFTAGFRAFGSGVGWQSGAGIASNFGRVASGGVGGLARGAGLASLAALPALGMYAAGSYALGQMAEGAQFQGQVNSTLQNTFRFTNPQSRTGYGFGQLEQRQIGSMLQQMGTQDMMTTPRELLGLVQQGSQMGVFRGVQDAREFRQKFTQMKDSLTEIAKTFNTTLSEALPFFQQARQQGFWTPQDITRHATQVRQVQANTGMSAQQAQAVMGMGAQMVRSIGGTGAQGSEMMGRAQMMAGSALFGGVVNDRSLSAAGFGTGAEGAQNLGMMLAGATTRFARSRVGRWALASMMNKDGTGLDTGALQRFTTGGMSVGEMGSRARRNVSGGGAYNFVMNEEELRGQLAQQGPEAALGIVRSLTGGRLYGESGRDQLVTRRIIQRFMGGSSRQADIVAKMAREMPRMLAIQAARSEGSLDAQERQREQQMQDTYEGLKRRMGHWWDENITGPMKELGAGLSFRVGRSWQRFTDRLFGTTGRGVGLSAEAVRSMVRSAMTGDREYMAATMGGPGLMAQELGGSALTEGYAGIEGGSRMMRLGFKAQKYGNLLSVSDYWKGARFRSADTQEMEALGRASRGVAGEAEAATIGYGSTGEMSAAMGGQGAAQLQKYLQSGSVLALRGRFGGDDLSGYQQEKYARQVLERVRSGEAGTDAQRMFQGLGDRQALGRLMAMQGSARGGFSGLGDLGIELREGQSRREAIEKLQTSTVEDLATELRGGKGDNWLNAMFGAGSSAGGIQGVAVTEQSLEEVKRDGRGERALRLFARARQLEMDKADPEKIEAARGEARRLMAELGNDKSVSKEARSAAIRLGDKGDAQAAALANLAGRVGASIMVGDQEAFLETMKRRRTRFREVMSSGAGMGALERAAGGDRSALTAAFRGAMSDASSAEEHVTRMEGLARAAAADPEKAAQMLAVMREEGLEGTDIGVTLSSALRVSDEAKRMGLKKDIEEGGAITDKARRGVRKRLGDLGIKGVDRKGIDALIRGGDTDAVREQLKAQGYKDSSIASFLSEMRGGMTGDEIREAGVRGAAAGGLKTLSDKVAKRAGLDPSELTGKIGERDSPTVQELKAHTVYFQKIHETLLATNRGEKIPIKNPKGTT